MGGGGILGCSWGGEGELRYNTPVTRMDYHHANEILRSPQGHALFIGDCSAAEDVGWLHEQNVRTGDSLPT